VNYERGVRIAENPGDRKRIYRELEKSVSTIHVIDEVDGWNPEALH
jgi:hypothetical protein